VSGADARAARAAAATALSDHRMTPLLLLLMLGGRLDRSFPLPLPRAAAAAAAADDADDDGGGSHLFVRAGE